MLTLLAFVASCERAAVREYVSTKTNIPSHSGGARRNRAGTEFSPDPRDQFEGASTLATTASGADAEGQLCRPGSRRSEGGYFCD